MTTETTDPGIVDTAATGTARARLQHTGRALKRSVRRFGRDQRGLTVSAVILIGILVVATAAFGLIASNKIGEAGEVVDAVTFDE